MSRLSHLVLVVLLFGVYIASFWTPVVMAAVGVTEKLACVDTDDNDASWQTDTAGSCGVSAGTMSIASNAYGLCFVQNTATAANLGTPTLTGGSMTTWAEIGNGSYDVIATPTSRITAFRGLGTGAAAAALVAAYGANQTSVIWNCWETTGIDLGGTNGSTATVQFKTEAGDSVTECSPTFDSGLGATQVVFQFTAVGGTKTLGTDTSFTGNTEQVNATPVSNARTEYLVNGADATPAITWTGGIATGCIAVEVKEAAAAGGGGRNFPVLGLGE
jgi:hypothetical protein